MRRIFKHMSKEQIEKTKSSAKHRKNRQLPDGEFRRVFAQFRPKGDDIDDLPIVDLTKKAPTYSERILENAQSLVQARKKVKIQTVGDRGITAPVPQFRAEPINNFKDIKSKIGELMAEATFTNPTIDSVKDPKKFRRMTKKQFQSLMRKASTELGINDNKGIGTMNLEHTGPYTNEDLIDVILNNHDLGWNMRKDYQKIIKGKRLNFGEQLSILHYLMMRKTTAVPMCLRSNSNKTDVVRRGIVKPRGDIKERPFRIIPDEQYELEIHVPVGSKRTKFDYFDKLDIGRKIEWARYANLILGIATKDMREIRISTKQDADVAMFAMKYACKMAKLPEFKGIFTNPYWIYYRAFEFCNHMTNREYKAFYDMALEYLSVSPRHSIPVISAKEAVEKLIPTLKATGKYKEYVKNQRTPSKYNDRINLEAVTKLLLQRERV